LDVPKIKLRSRTKSNDFFIIVNVGFRMCRNIFKYNY
jgi:hypothetical protein